MPILSQRAFDARHAANLGKYSRQLKKAYLNAIKEISKLAISLSLNSSSEFYFRNYSEVNKKVNAIVKSLYTEVYGSSVSGIHSEWDLAVEKNNKLANYVYGKDLDKLPAQYRNKYLSNNAAARRNFVFRKDNGLGLSNKIWNNTKQFKQEMELALELGIGKGKSAQSMATSVTRYLNEPDKLFRRVRAKEGGILRLSKAAKAYNPGQGRYRSSYKNALRLTRNETNFSYQASQQEKIKKQDFIVGIKIKTSPQHVASSDKGGISCISLQGNYPKDFDWTYKWHVNCICLSLNILKTRSELDADTEKILTGGGPNTPSKNQVGGLPGNYNSYLNNNADKWKNWKNLPRTFEGNKNLKPIIPSKDPVYDVASYSKGFKNYNHGNFNEDHSIAQKDYEKAPYKKYADTHSIEYKAMNGYSKNDYKFIREYLTGVGSKYTESINKNLFDIKKQIKNMSKYIDDNKITQNLKIYRRIRMSDGKKYFSKLKIGTIYTDKSFVSTALVPDKFFGKYEIQIFAKNGSRIANIGNRLELEYLIQKGSKFRVLENDIANNRIVVQLL